MASREHTLLQRYGMPRHVRIRLSSIWVLQTCICEWHTPMCTRSSEFRLAGTTIDLLWANFRNCYGTCSISRFSCCCFCGGVGGLLNKIQKFAINLWIAKGALVFTVGRISCMILHMYGVYGIYINWFFRVLTQKKRVSLLPSWLHNSNRTLLCCSLFVCFLGNLIQTRVPYELLLLDSNYEPKSSGVVRTNAEKAWDCL